jgi:hypothetical protein
MDKKTRPVSNYLNKNYLSLIFLYNKGEYESVVAELEEFESNYWRLLEIIPSILENCKNITNKYMWPKDKIHFRNELILRHFGWVDKIKFITGIASFIIFMSLSNKYAEGMSFYAFLLRWPFQCLFLIALIILTYKIHVWMKNFTISKDLIRCKHCGRYTYYMSPNCRKCKKADPVPNFYWDCLVDLENMIVKSAVQEDFYHELKERYSSKYAIWKQNKMEALDSSVSDS